MNWYHLTRNMKKIEKLKEIRKQLADSIDETNGGVTSPSWYREEMRDSNPLIKLVDLLIDEFTLQDEIIQDLLKAVRDLYKTGGNLSIEKWIIKK